MQAKKDIFDIINNKDIANELFQYFKKYSDLAHFLQTNTALLPLIARTDIGKQLILHTEKYKKALATNEWLKIQPHLVSMLGYEMSLLTFASIPYIASCHYSKDIARSLVILPFAAIHGISVGSTTQFKIKSNNKSKATSTIEIKNNSNATWDAVVIPLATFFFVNLITDIWFCEHHVMAYASLSSLVVFLGEALGILTGSTVESMRRYCEKNYKEHSDWLNRSTFFYPKTVLGKEDLILNNNDEICQTIRPLRECLGMF